MSVWPHRVAVEPFVVYDENNLGQYGATVTAPALVVPGARRVLTATGEEVVGRATVYVQGDVPIGTDDRVTVLNDGLLENPQLAPLLDVQIYSDLRGVRRVTVVVA